LKFKLDENMPAGLGEKRFETSPIDCGTASRRFDGPLRARLRLAQPVLDAQLFSWLGDIADTVCNIRGAGQVARRVACDGGLNLPDAVGRITNCADHETRDPYLLEFLNLKDEYSETQLEDALIEHLEAFLLELGSGFTFVARQKQIRIGDEWYRIDLLLFHRMFISPGTPHDAVRRPAAATWDTCS